VRLLSAALILCASCRTVVAHAEPAVLLSPSPTISVHGVGSRRRSEARPSELKQFVNSCLHHKLMDFPREESTAKRRKGGVAPAGGLARPSTAKHPFPPLPPPRQGSGGGEDFGGNVSRRPKTTFPALPPSSAVEAFPGCCPSGSSEPRLAGHARVAPSHLGTTYAPDAPGAFGARDATHASRAGSGTVAELPHSMQAYLARVDARCKLQTAVRCCMHDYTLHINGVRCCPASSGDDACRLSSSR
jgi:hypothetical protein